MGSTVENMGERTKPKVVNKVVKGAGSNEDLTVLIKGDNVFGTTVSKSFVRETASGSREVDTVNISVASYRVVEVCTMIGCFCGLLFIGGKVAHLHPASYYLIVQKARQICSISRDLPRRWCSRHNWCLETILGL